MFLKNVLAIPDAKRRFVQDSFGLLKDILRRYLQRIPFQSITSLGSIKNTAKGRPTPTFRDVLSTGFEGIGGLCLHNNYFLRLQLESIGYEVTSVSACFRRNGIPLSHSLNVVKVKPDRKSAPKSYLVDAGCGIPLHEPVPLFDLPYRSRAGGFQFRFEHKDEWNIQRVHENGDALIGEKPADFLSPQDCEINLKPKDFLDIHPPVHVVYSNPKSMYLHQHIYCFRYLKIDDNDFEIVCIKGPELILITKETRIVQSFKDYYELRPIILKYFPMISTSEVDRALENYQNPISF